MSLTISDKKLGCIRSNYLFKMNVIEKVYRLIKITELNLDHTVVRKLWEICTPSPICPHIMCIYSYIHLYTDIKYKLLYTKRYSGYFWIKKGIQSKYLYCNPHCFSYSRYSRFVRKWVFLLVLNIHYEELFQKLLWFTKEGEFLLIAYDS